MICREKCLKTMQVFDAYEKDFAQARVNRSWRDLTEVEVRKAVIEETKKVLKYDEKLMPQIHNMEEISYQDFSTYRLTQLRYQTWNNFYAVASLYVPY